MRPRPTDRSGGLWPKTWKPLTSRRLRLLGVEEEWHRHRRARYECARARASMSRMASRGLILLLRGILRASQASLGSSFFLAKSLNEEPYFRLFLVIPAIFFFFPFLRIPSLCICRFPRP